MTKKRDPVYENNMRQHIEKTIRTLKRHSDMPAGERNEDVYLAAVHSLQTLIEGFIGFARYTLEVCYDIRVTKTRQAIDEFKSLQLYSKRLIFRLGAASPEQPERTYST